MKSSLSFLSHGKTLTEAQLEQASEGSISPVFTQRGISWVSAWVLLSVHARGCLPPPASHTGGQHGPRSRCSINSDYNFDTPGERGQDAFSSLLDENTEKVGVCVKSGLEGDLESEIIGV